MPPTTTSTEAATPTIAAAILIERRQRSAWRKRGPEDHEMDRLTDYLISAGEERPREGELRSAPFSGSGQVNCVGRSIGKSVGFVPLSAT
jgi:hypothetical protein